MAVKSERMPNPIDPAVDHALGNGRDIYSRIKRQREMTPGQRKRAERDAQRSRVQYDLPDDMINQVDRLANDVYHCPPSHLIGLFIMVGLAEIESGRLDIADYLEPAKSLRWDYRINLCNVDPGNCNDQP